MDQGLNQPAEQAAENSPGWSRAEPWVRRLRTSLARLSGRQRTLAQRLCRPLKRAEDHFPNNSQGGASLHAVSRRLPWAIFCRLLRRLVEQFRSARLVEWLSRRMDPAAGLVSSHWRRAFTTLTVCALVVWSGTTNRLHFVGPSATPTVVNENQIDSALQSAASNA